MCSRASASRGTPPCTRCATRGQRSGRTSARLRDRLRPHEVVTVDVARGRILWRTAVPGPARHISRARTATALWTALGTKAERMAVLDIGDPRRPRLVRTLTPPFLAHDVVFAPDGEHVWVTSGDGQSARGVRARRHARRWRSSPLRRRRSTSSSSAAGPSSRAATTARCGCTAPTASSCTRRVPVGSFNVTLGGARA